MIYPHRPRNTRTAVAASTATLMFFVAGCTTLPGDSTPHVVRQYQAPTAEIDIPKPQPNMAADLVLRDFYSAMAHPQNDYAAARAFMTPELASNWQSERRTRVVDSINLIAQASQKRNNQSFFVRSTVQGLVGDDGAYAPTSDDYNRRVAMVLGEDGQWRISDAPNGALVERQVFLDNNAPRNVYFLDPTGNQLVTDRRWIYRGVHDGVVELLDKLKNGPSAPLLPGVTSALPNTAQISVADSSGSKFGERVIDITGVGQMDNPLRTMLAAQIVWTLAAADMRGPWILHLDGQPLVPGHDGPWTRDTDEVRTFDPSRAPADRVRMRTVDSSGIFEIVDGQAYRMTNGWGRTGSSVLTSASVGVDVNGSEILAAVARSDANGDNGSTLLLGLTANDPSPVLKASSLSRPSWSPDAAAVWTVKDGRTVVRVVRSAESTAPAVEEVDNSELSALIGTEEPAISEFRVDSSGTQVAMIVDGGIYVATIQRSDSTPWKLVRPRKLPIADSVNPVTLAWSANHSITVGAYGADAPMLRYYPDGATSSTLPKLNLSPPVTVVTAAGKDLYALDTNALLELISGEGEEQFWRVVQGVPSRMAPVSVE